MRSNPTPGVLAMAVIGWWLSTPLPAAQSETANAIGAVRQPAAPTAYLRWHNGDVLPGRLLEGKDDAIRWVSPIFADELLVDTQALDAIVFSGRTVHARETFRVGTTSGDVFSADLVGSDESAFLFSSRRFGQVRVRREAVYSLNRRVHPNLVFDGSQFEDWDLAREAPIKDLSYKVYKEDRGWHDGEFPDLSKLNPVDEGRFAAGYLDLGFADVEGRFGMVFEGRLEIAEAGQHRFDLWADDKARLFIDGRLIVDFLEMGREPEGGGHSQFVHLGTGCHFLRIEYLELGGGFRLVAGVTGPDSKRRSLAGTTQGSGWKRGPGGHPYTARKKTDIFREIEVSRRCEIDLELASSESPRFVLVLGKDQQSAESVQSLRLETWGDELVVVQDQVFEPVMTIEQQVREVRLQLALDSEAGEVTLFDANGRVLAEVGGIRAMTGESGITLRNRGQDLTVRRLRVYRQPDEAAGQPLDSSKARVHLNTGRVMVGQLMVEDGGAFVVGQEGVRQAIDLTVVDRLASPDTKLTVSSGPAELSYVDGSVVRGCVEHADADRVMLRTSFSDTPVACNLAGASTLRFRPTASGFQPPTRDRDRLFFAPGHLRGELAFDVAGSPLGWKPDGAATALRLTAAEGARIERSRQRVSHQSAFDSNQFPHLLHLKTGEIIPCTVVSYTRETLGFESPFVSGLEIASTHVKGIEFTPARKGLPRDRSSEPDSWLDGLLGSVSETFAVDDLKLQRALTVPRLTRESPPSHILVAKTGDLKRGTLLGIRGPTIRFESKLREMSVPTDRISCVVSISNAERFGENDADPPDVARAAVVTSESLRNRTVRATLADGSVLIFEPQRAKDGDLAGLSTVYGGTTIPIESIESLAFGLGESENRQSRFAEWVVRPAQEPQFSE